MRSDFGKQATGRQLAPLRLPLKLGYAAGALFDGIGQQAINIFLFFYVTAVCGLSPALTGVALAAGLVVDAVCDPLIGSLSDASRSRFGRRLPFLFFGLPGTMVFLVLIFSLPRGLSQSALFAWVTTLSIGLRVSISLFLLPFNAAGAELSDDYAERSSIAAWRWGFAMIGALIAIVCGFGVFLGGDGGLANRAAYSPFAVTLSVIMAVGAAVSMRTLAMVRDRQHRVQDSEQAAHARPFAELGEMFRNQSFRTLFAGGLLLFTALSLHSTLGLHANNYFWRMTPGQIQTVTLALFAGLLLGAPFAGPLLKRLEKRTVLLIGITGLGTALSGPATLRLLGLFPFTGTSMVAIIASAVFLGGALMAGAAIAFASMMADAADEHEHLFGGRREGMYFAGWAFATKAAGGVGALLSGAALQLIGFPSGGVTPAPGVLSPAMVAWLATAYGPGSGLFALAAALSCMSYRLNGRKHAAILADLNTRRGAPLAASVPLGA